MKKVIFLSIFILFLSELIFPNILKVEPIPGQTYKIINNKQIVPFETAWQDIWKNIDKLDYRQQIAVATYIINFINPDFIDAYIVRGDAYFATNNYIEAIADYKTALKQQSDNATFNYKLGITYNYINHTEALTYLNNAVSLNNTNGDYYFERGYAQYNQFNKNAAEKDYNTACLMNSKFTSKSYPLLNNNRKYIAWNTALNKAVYYNKCEMYRHAYSYFFDVVNYQNLLHSFNPSYTILTTNTENKSWFFLEILKSAINYKYYQTALNTAKYGIQSNNLPTDILAELYMWQSFAFAGNGQTEDAQISQLKALKLSPQNPRIYWILGDIYQQIYNDTDNAIKNYQKSLNLMPRTCSQYSKLIIILAETYKKSGDIIKAHSLAYNWLISQKQMLSIDNPDPINAPVYLSYAKAYDILGNTQLAQIYYHTALALNSEYDIPTKYYPNKNEQITYLPSIIININDNTYVELNSYPFIN